MRIVIAEDNAPLAEGLAYWLRKAGHEVAVAFDGEMALRHLHDGPTDLLILDYGLPKIDGAQVLRAVRARAEHLPVMLFSALDDAESRLVRQGLHVDVVLAKPFGLADFEACIRRVQGRGESEPSDAPPALSEDETQVLGILRNTPAEANRSADIARKLLDVGIAVTAEEVESCIDRLNRKLCARSTRVVRVRGLGYTLVESAPSQSPLILE